ncbi:hypothetical protein C2S53_000260 [Perilla frutescens var. hirtella]|uniref:Pyrrolo-quinoline quinone repeat domain-containing protein n=1 Tax=Perilla frutescens var. hirtella TaxID=608512 RepID=A0AAD4P8L3_PERFH|nr:hypothetical protein C2S53_000260 [Perilla frutescens var. hirtella]
MENFFRIYFLSISIFCLITAASTSSPNKERRFEGRWLNHGGNIYNRRQAEGETKISPSTASQLRLRWEFNAGKDISATPAISVGVVYFPSWNGYIYAVRASDGSLVWKQKLQELTGLSVTVPLPNVTALVSVATPTVAGHKLLVSIYGPAYVVAMELATGELLWTRQLDTHPAAAITMSGTYYKGGFYVGTSSFQRSFRPENCCTFRGSFSKLDTNTGGIIWQTFMVPDNNGERGGYAGAAVWGSSPSIDVSRNFIYIATGIINSVPQPVQDCQSLQNNQSFPSHPDECTEPHDHSSSILALDMDSGEIKWYQQIGGYNVSLFACRNNNSSSSGCPSSPTPYSEFGEAPMMLTTYAGGLKRDVVTAVQKSGFAWTLDRDDGHIVWFTEAGPGSFSGGGIWGAATDERRVYTNIGNANNQNFTLLPSSNITTGGGWVAMDAPTGRILWSTAVPNDAISNPVTVANGVVFAGSTYRTGPVYAMDGENGEIVWSYETGATVYGGVSVSKGCVYVGSGYGVGLGASNPSFTSGTSVFAFCVD